MLKYYELEVKNYMLKNKIVAEKKRMLNNE